MPRASSPPLPTRARRLSACWRAALLAGLVALPPGCASGEAAGRPRRVPVGHTGSFTSWWSDAKMREQGEYLDGQRHGPVTSYHPDGSLAEQGTWERGVLIGRHAVHHLGGVLALEESVVDGVVDGERREYDTEGRLVAVQTFVRGQRHGSQRGFHPSGRPAREGAWAHDLPTGRWQSFDELGRPSAEEWFWSAGGRPVGYLETVLAPDGRVTAQAFKRWRDGHWVGWRSFWHANGVQAGLVEYLDDLRHGRDLSWSPSGLPLVEGRREADRRVGIWRHFDDQGRLLQERDESAASPDGSDEGGAPPG